MATTVGPVVMTCCNSAMTRNDKKPRFDCANCKAHVEVEDASLFNCCESCGFYVWHNYTFVEGVGDDQRMICTTCREKAWSSGDEGAIEH